MIFKNLFSGFIGFVLILSPVWAQDMEREAGSLTRFFPHWDEYLSTREEERSAFSPVYIVNSDRGPSPDAIEMWYQSSDMRVEFDIREDGRIMNPPSQGELEQSPQVWVNQPAGTMSMTVRFEPLLAMSSVYDVVDFELSMQQVNQAMRQTGGVAALFSPEFKTVSFIFDGIVPEAWAIHEDGSRTPLLVQENLAVYRSSHRSMRRVVRLEFGHAPQSMVLVP